MIETATPACSVALVAGDRVLRSRHEEVGRGHAERLLPMIAELLDGARPDGLAVDCGPGSFTGVRVGLAAAKALALAWLVPVAGFSSLALIAAGVAADGVAVAVPGGHGELFVQSFAGTPPRAVTPLRSLVPADAAAMLSEPLVAGAGAAAVVAARGWGEARGALPRADDFLLLAAADRLLDPTPIYGRAPDARPVAGP